MPHDPTTDHFHDVTLLCVVEHAPSGDVMPTRQTGATASCGGVLRDEHGMPVIRRLAAVVTRLGRGQPVLDQLFGVFADGRDPSHVDHRSFLATEAKLCAEMVPADLVQPDVQPVHATTRRG